MAEDGDARRLHRANEPGRLVARVAKLRVDRGDDGRDLGDPRREDVDRPVLRDVRFGPEEHDEATVGPFVRPVHLPPLGAEVARKEPSRHGTVPGVIRQEGIAVAARVEGAVKRGERHPPVRPVRVEMDVPPEVGHRDPLRSGEDPVDVGLREEVRLDVFARVFAVEDRRELFGDDLVRAAGEKASDGVRGARRDAGEGDDRETPPPEIDVELPEGPGGVPVLGRRARPRLLRVRKGEKSRCDPCVRDRRRRPRLRIRRHREAPARL